MLFNMTLGCREQTISTIKNKLEMKGFIICHFMSTPAACFLKYSTGSGVKVCACV